MKIVDGDSHLIEPLDLYEKYCDSGFRDRAMGAAKDPKTGGRVLVVDGRPMHLGSDTDEMLSIVVGYGQKEAGSALNEFDRSLYLEGDWQNMTKRVQFLDTQNIDYQVLYPTLGLLWEGEVSEPRLAAALCRAYNTWAFEICTGHLDRLLPIAHASRRPLGGPCPPPLRQQAHAAEWEQRAVGVCARPRMVLPAEALRTLCPDRLRPRQLDLYIAPISGPYSVRHSHLDTPFARSFGTNLLSDGLRGCWVGRWGDRRFWGRLTPVSRDRLGFRLLLRLGLPGRRPAMPSASTGMGAPPRCRGPRCGRQIQASISSDGQAIARLESFTGVGNRPSAISS